MNLWFEIFYNTTSSFSRLLKPGCLKFNDRLSLKNLNGILDVLREYSRIEHTINQYRMETKGRDRMLSYCWPACEI